MDIERWWTELHDMDGFLSIGGVDERIARASARCGGVLDRAQLEALCVGRGAFEHRVAAGRLRRVFRGVYAVGHEVLTPRGRLVAALLAVGRPGTLSHETAAWLRALRSSMPPYVAVTTRGRARSRPGLRAHTAATLEVRSLHGLPVTTAVRTLHDLAATRPRAEVERAVNEALVLRAATAEQLLARSGAGAAVLRAIAGDAAPTRSALERRFRRALRCAGLPEPATDRRFGRYIADFYFPEHALIVETDGWGSHGHRLAFERDRARDAELLARGIPVMRITERQVAGDLPAAIDRLARALAQRAPRAATA